jgi:hypothetical protein
MGVYEGRGNLAKAFKSLEARWMEAKESWDDPRSREFEQRFLVPLEMDLRSAVSAMDQMAVVISRIHQECE